MPATKRQKMIRHIAQVLELMDLSTEKEGLKDTPQRFVDYLLEFNQTFDPEELLGEGFTKVPSHSGMVVQTNIPFRMACEHHLLPALGKACVGYIPGKVHVGLSKLTRLVRAVGLERPNLQEIICDRISDILMQHLEAKGVVVVIKAEHSCMACRGIAAPGVITCTSSVRGIFRDVPAAREEFFNLTK